MSAVLLSPLSPLQTSGCCCLFLSLSCATGKCCCFMCQAVLQARSLLLHPSWR